MSYRVRIPTSVLRDIDRLPCQFRQRVRREIADLSLEPRPRHAKALQGELLGYWRVRLDGYRIFYRIEVEELVIEVMRVARRTSSTYEELA